MFFASWGQSREKGEHHINKEEEVDALIGPAPARVFVLEGDVHRHNYTDDDKENGVEDVPAELELVALVKEARFVLLWLFEGIS